ncbi:BrxA/BrxB family bacilliredoxin [bacterium]|nr:BrxA/BrxB family bacilliredoxin [bacterium]
MQSMYDPEMVRPMWEELEQVGIQPITSAEDVDRYLGNRQGTVLLVINSVCGCSAGNARPGVMLALQHEVIPDKSITVFAGVDHDATNKAREYIQDVPPSSPFIALFKEGEPVFVLERRQIELMDRDQVAFSLKQAFDEFGSKKGPSIPAEQFEKITPVQQCGSTIPLV